MENKKPRAVGQSVLFMFVELVSNKLVTMIIEDLVKEVNVQLIEEIIMLLRFTLLLSMTIYWIKEVANNAPCHRTKKRRKKKKKTRR